MIRMKRRDDRPAPRDRDRAAVVPACAELGEAAGEDRDDRERDGEVGEAGPRAVQVLAVPELGQVLLVVGEFATSAMARGLQASGTFSGTERTRCSEARPARNPLVKMLREIGMNSDHWPLVVVRRGDRLGPRAAIARSGRDLTEAVLRPTRGNHAFEACVEQLATTIRLGVYPLGSTLPSERELAERLNVSRPTLREAMAALRAGRPGRDPARPRRRHGRHHQAPDPVRPAPPPGSPRPGARTGSTPWTSGGSSSQERPAWPPARTGRDALGPARRGPRGGRGRPPAGPSTGRPTRGSISRSRR